MPLPKLKISWGRTTLWSIAPYTILIAASYGVWSAIQWVWKEHIVTQSQLQAIIATTQAHDARLDKQSTHLQRTDTAVAVDHDMVLETHTIVKNMQERGFFITPPLIPPPVSTQPTTHP